MSPYYLVKIQKEVEIDRKQKIGGLYVPANLVYFSRNTQCGEIVSIGSLAHKYMPMAKVGDTLLMHHFVQGTLEKKNDRTSLVFSDDKYNYYIVTGFDFNGNGNQTFGIFDGEKIIPHPDFVFLDKEVSEADITTSDFLVIPQIKKMSNNAKQKRLAELKHQIKALTSNKMTSEIRDAIIKKDKERELITMSLHKREYLEYKVAYSNPNQNIKKNTVFALNIATNYMLEFQNKEYRVVEIKYLGLY